MLGKLESISDYEELVEEIAGRHQGIVFIHKTGVDLYHMKKVQTSFFEQYRKRCERSNYGKPVVIPANDPANGTDADKIDILFVNERPGPTALKTNLISFENPDGSARRFKRFFNEAFGLKYRKRIFITNAVLWCPKVKEYKNLTPTALEIEKSSDVLLDQIKHLKPKLIVAVGGSALRALRLCFENDEKLARTKSVRLENIVAKLITKKPYKISFLFHTSQRNAGNRADAEQLKDWKKLKKILLL